MKQMRILLSFLRMIVACIFLIALYLRIPVVSERVVLAKGERFLSLELKVINFGDIAIAEDGERELDKFPLAVSGIANTYKISRNRMLTMESLGNSLVRIELSRIPLAIAWAKIQKSFF